MKHFLYLILFLAPAAFSQEIRGLYVNGFSSIVGDTEREDSLLRFAENNGFNYLTLYEIHIVNANTPLTNVSSAQTFADFVEKAKTQYSIAEIGVAAENFNALNNVIHVYNQQHADENQKIDVYNLEFEFWVSGSVEPGGYYCDTYLQPNGFPCSEEGAFSFFIETLHKIDSLATLDGAESESYFGWFDAEQGAAIAESGVDRVLLSTYIPSVNYSASYQYSYLQSRLEALASAQATVNVVALYSSEPDFMQDWAISNTSFFEPLFGDLESELAAETNPDLEYIVPHGIQWFAYSYLPKKNMDLSVVESMPENLLIYPNPSDGEVHVSLSEEVFSIIVSDLEGRTVFQTETAFGAIDISLPQGVYLVSIRTKDGEANRYSVVK